MKNGVLVFLSEIHLDREGRLIATAYQAGDGKTVSCYQTNAATIKYLMEILHSRGETIDRIFAFSTRRTQENIEYWTEDLSARCRKVQRDIFADDIAAAYPELSGRITYVDYDEGCQAANVTSYVMNMVDAICCVTGTENQQWRMHTDLTGGMRHAATLMLAVLHMLKYTGIAIGDAYYANYSRNDQKQNRMENVSAIHGMFEFISSTDALVNGARLNELESYFQKVPPAAQSPQLRQLLEAFGKFSDAVLLCRTGLFMPALGEMSEALAAFKAYENKSTYEKLFAQVLRALEREYGTLLAGRASRLEIIRWCIRKKFLQQAMTLFNEWISEEIVSRRIFYPAPDYYEAIAAACTKLNMGFKSMATVLVYEFYKLSTQKASYANLPPGVVLPAKPFNEYRIFMANGGGGDMPQYIPPARLSNLLLAVEHIQQIQADYLSARISHEEFCQKYPELYAFLDYKRQESIYKYWPEFFLHTKFKSTVLCNTLSVAPEAVLRRMFFPEAAKPAPPQLEAKAEPHAEDDEFWAAYNGKYEHLKRLRAMLEAGLLKTDADRGTLIGILQNVHWLHKQRNEINHAKNDSYVVSNQEIVDCMLKTMDAIEEAGKQ